MVDMSENQQVGHGYIKTAYNFFINGFMFTIS